MYLSCWCHSIVFLKTEVKCCDILLLQLHYDSNNLKIERSSVKKI